MTWKVSYEKLNMYIYNVLNSFFIAFIIRFQGETTEFRCFIVSGQKSFTVHLRYFKQDKLDVNCWSISIVFRCHKSRFFMKFYTMKIKLAAFITYLKARNSKFHYIIHFMEYNHLWCILLELRYSNNNKINMICIEEVNLYNYWEFITLFSFYHNCLMIF